MNYDTLIKKEKVIFQSFKSSETDTGRIVAFKDYVDFINNDGKSLIINIKNELDGFNKDNQLLQNEKQKLCDKFQTLLDFLDTKATELGIRNEIKEDIFDISCTLNGNSTDSIFNENILMDFRDIFSEYISLGHEKEVSDFFVIDKFNNPQSNLSEELKNVKSKQDVFNKRFTTSKAYFLDFLNQQYNYLSKLVELNPNEKIDFRKNSIEQLNDKIYEKEYQILINNPLIEEAMNMIHSHVEQNIQDETTDKLHANKVFYIKDEKIHHWQKGELRLKREREPDYIKMFKIVLSYVSDSDKIKITDFEKKIPKEKRGLNYRLGIGKSSRAFRSFLETNNVENINPGNKKPVIEATDDYITTNNKI